MVEEKYRRRLVGAISRLLPATSSSQMVEEKYRRRLVGAISRLLPATSSSVQFCPLPLPLLFTTNSRLRDRGKERGGGRGGEITLIDNTSYFLGIKMGFCPLSRKKDMPPFIEQVRPWLGLFLYSAQRVFALLVAARPCKRARRGLGIIS